MPITLVRFVFMLTFCLLVQTAHAAEPKSLLDLASPDTAKQLLIQSDQVSVETGVEGNMVVHVKAGEHHYPGFVAKGPEGGWNLSQYGHIEVAFHNPDKTFVDVHLRVDNEGDHRNKPWNTEVTRVEPGRSAKLKVIFGYHHGFNPGYKLDPSKVSKILIFTRKNTTDRKFYIKSIVAGGQSGEKPPVKPKKVRIKPKNGFLLGSADIKISKDQLYTPKGVQGKVVKHNGQDMVEFTLPASANEHVFSIRPPMGRYNVANSTETRFMVRNIGKTPVTVGAALYNAKHEETRTIFTDQPIAPGKASEIVVPYTPENTWIGPSGDLSKHKNRKAKHGNGSHFSAHIVRAMRLIAKHEGAAVVRLESIKATVTPIKRPDWLGKRPPVEGDWKLTLNENFDGNEIDLNRWRYYGPNWWGQKKLTHWSKDNVIVGDGVVRIRMEKRTGWHNDNPATKHKSPYAGGLLEGYGKWVQRYGYFESRMKLPTAEGLWPAFWTMPDRGPEAGPQWKRADTGNGGMEFDIMEHLTRWGPYRYTIAMHWDGYGKNHKATGTRVYFQPDEDGYVTSGLLWLPGKVVFYCQGKEVARWENERVCSVRSNILYTMPIGGWDNDPINDKQLPDDFVIDYVRVWQRADLASEVDGYMSKPAE